MITEYELERAADRLLIDANSREGEYPCMPEFFLIARERRRGELPLDEDIANGISRCEAATLISELTRSALHRACRAEGVSQRGGGRSETTLPLRAVCG